MADANRPAVAVIGLGQMGLPMARRLLGAGFPVRGSDLSERARDALATSGDSAFAAAREAAEGADVVITILPDGRIVRDVLLGTGSVAQAMKPGGLVIDMSSSAPTDTLALGADLAARGIRMIDCPVSGGVRRAVDGSLAIMAGGAEGDVAAARPLLEAMGSRIFPTGKLGTAHAMKALNNFMSAIGTAAASEAIVAGRAFGLDPAVMTDILNASTGRNNATEVKLKQHILPETWGSGFSIGLMAKDVGIAAALARSLGLDLPLLAMTAQQWTQAAQKLGPGADHTEIMRQIIADADAQTSGE
jgi:3-hydroxyisobutyrate dehydrogenase